MRTILLVLWPAFQGLLAFREFDSQAPNTHVRLLLAIGPSLTSIPVLLGLSSLDAVLNLVPVH
jgi:hypothetical protein